MGIISRVRRWINSGRGTSPEPRKRETRTNDERGHVRSAVAQGQRPNDRRCRAAPKLAARAALRFYVTSPPQTFAKGLWKYSPAISRGSAFEVDFESALDPVSLEPSGGPNERETRLVLEWEIKDLA